MQEAPQKTELETRLRRLFAVNYYVATREQMERSGFDVAALTAAGLIDKSDQPGSPNYFMGPNLSEEPSQPQMAQMNRR